MKKIFIGFILLLMILFSGCADKGRKIVVQGTITDMIKYQINMDDVVDTTFDNNTTYTIRLSDLVDYKIFKGDYVKLELHQITGGEFYFIYKQFVIE